MGTTYTLSGDFSDLLGDEVDTGKISAYVRTNLPAGTALIDTTATADSIRLGNGKITVAADGTWSITLLGTANTGLNVAANTLRYEVVAEYVDRASRGRSTWRSGFFELTANSDLKTLATAVEPIAAVSASGYALEAKGYRDEAAAITGLTGEDAAIANRINTPGSLTDQALTATIGAVVPDVVERREVAAGPAVLPAKRLTGTYLSKWDAAVSQVRSGIRDAKVLCIGDSTTAGAGGGTEATWTAQRSYPHYLAEYLNERMIPAANGLQIPRATSGGSPNDTRWTAGSGWAKSDGNDAVYAFIGFGGKGCSFIANFDAAGVLTFNDPRITADTFDVYYMTTTGTGASFTAQATGGAASALTPTGGLAAKGIAKVTVSAGSAATNNVVTIDPGGAAGAVIIVGIEPYLSTAKKVRVGNAGASGSSSVTWTAFSSGSALNTWNSVDAIKAYAPDLTIIDLGINDSDPANLTPDATYNANIQTLINAALVSGDVILKTSIPVENRETKQAALATIARGKDYGLIDVLDAWGTADLADRAGLVNPDNIHANQAGYQVVAAHVFSALLGRPAPSGSGAQTFLINGPAGSDRQVVFQTSGNSRWQLRVNASAESGGNAGSDLVLIPRSDGGGQLTPVFTVTRSNSRITLGEAVDLATGAVTGTKIGVSAAQKLGFYGATPVARPAANPDTSGATLAALETEVNELKAMLRTLGLLTP